MNMSIICRKYKHHHYTTSSDSSCDSTASSSTETSSEEQRKKKRKLLKDKHKLDKNPLKSHHEEKKKHKRRHKKRKEKMNDDDSKKKSIKKMKEHKQKQKQEKNMFGKKKKSFETRSPTVHETNTATPLFGPLPSGHSLGPPPTSTSSLSPVVTDEPKTIRSLAPMTKEQYEKQQSILRRVVDPVTGRTRLVKGDGEIMEEIVSKERHKAINKLATEGDGYSFQAGMRKLK